VILIVLIGLDSIASGYIGRHVAVEFEGAREGAEELASVRDRHVICPHCRQRFVRQTSKVDFDGMVSCPHCGGKITGQPDGPGPTDSFDSFNQ
jgi:ribosomal protein L37AE/L43A